MMRVMGSAVLATGIAIVAACSQPPQDPAPLASAAPPPAPVSLPAAVLPDGFEVRLELALTPQEVADGLMYRPSLPADRGMLFLFAEDRRPAFWMKNTLIPLDLVFLDSAGAVVEVVANAPPCAAEPCPTYSPARPARAVLELAAGVAGAHGVAPGAFIDFARVPGYPVEKEESEVRN